MNIYDFVFNNDDSNDDSGNNSNGGLNPNPNYRDNSVLPGFDIPTQHHYHYDPYAYQREKFAEFGKQYSTSYEISINSSTPLEDPHTNFSYPQPGGETYGYNEFGNPQHEYSSHEYENYSSHQYSSHQYEGSPNTQPDNSEEGPDEEGLYPVRVSFVTDAEFASRDEITKWVNSRARQYGYLC